MKKTKNADPTTSKKLVLECETLRRHVWAGVRAGVVPSTTGGPNCHTTWLGNDD